MFPRGHKRDFWYKNCSHMNLFPRFRRLTLANQANVIFGVFVTIATIGNVIVATFQYESAKATATENSEQTKQLIVAANINACAARQIATASQRNATAAENFASAAGNINIHMSEAVTKLDTQAGKLAESAKQMGRLATDSGTANTQNLELFKL